MLRRLSPVAVHYSSDTETDGADCVSDKKPKSRYKRSGSVPRLLLRGIVTRKPNANANVTRPHTEIKRSHSYHNTAELRLTTAEYRGPSSTISTSVADMAAMSSAAPVPNCSSPSHDSAEAKQFIDAEEQPRGRKPSGGSQTLYDMFSLGFRFGGKKKKDAKKHSDLPSPVSQPPDELDITFFDVPPETLRGWKKSLEVVLGDPAGRVLFHRHLRVEHSMENMQFCKEIERFRTLPDEHLEREAKTIAARYVGDDTPKQLNIDSAIVKGIAQDLKQPHREMFNEARQQVYELMATDTFRRFKMSADFVKASERDRQRLNS